MGRRVAVLAALVLAPGAAAATQPPLPVDGLLRIAAGLTGLKAPARASVALVSSQALRIRAAQALDRRYPRALQAYDEQLYRALGLLGPAEPLRPALQHAYARPATIVVDAERGVVSVRAGPGARTLAVEGLVRLLQDRAYMLSPRIARVRASSDAAIAAAAAAAGVAEVAARSLRSVEGPRAPPTTRAGAFLALEAAFPAAVGTRLAANLYNVGGSAAIKSLLQRLPSSSEQVFHVDKYLAREQPAAIELPASPSGFQLARTDSFGELDVRALLAVFEVARLDRVGAGWGGGLSALYRNPDGRQAAALRLDWDTERDAQEWQEAVATFVNEAFDAGTPGPPATTPCEAASCWQLGGRSIAFVRQGQRSAFVVAPDVAAAAALATALAP